MTHIEVTTPHPACILPITHPARAQSRHVDVAKTWAEHADDYQREQIETAQSEAHKYYWSKA